MSGVTLCYSCGRASRTIGALTCQWGGKPHHKPPPATASGFQRVVREAAALIRQLGPREQQDALDWLRSSLRLQEWPSEKSGSPSSSTPAASSGTGGQGSPSNGSSSAAPEPSPAAPGSRPPIPPSLPTAPSTPPSPSSKSGKGSSGSGTPPSP